MKSLFLALVMVCLCVGVARADFEAYITDVGGGNLTGSTFQLSQDPWLFVQLPNPGFNVKWSLWAPNGEFPVYGGFDYSGNLTWLDKPTWSDITKVPGLWNVEVSMFQEGAAIVGTSCEAGVCESKTLPFSFAPEPISASLFLLGGAGLALARRKKA